jgi:hypothetical protein
MGNGTSKTARRAAALLVASAAVVLTAACGGSSGSSSSGSSSGGGQQPGGDGGGRNNAFAAYVQCLQQNGVTITMPSGGPRERPSDGASRGPGAVPSGAVPSGAVPSGAVPSGQPRPDGSRGQGRGGMGMTKPDGVDDATWQKAQTACASLQPSGRPGGGSSAAAG